MFSGDGIVAAGRKKIFSRVAEVRAQAARAGRARAARVSGDAILSGGGSTTSAGSPTLLRGQTDSLVSVFFYIYLFHEWNILLDPIFFF